MTLIVLLIALGILQFVDIGKYIHKDDWFHRWIDAVKRKNTVKPNNLTALALSIFIPSLLLLIVVIVFKKLSILLLIALSVLVLVYSFGRGEFNSVAKKYLVAWRSNDWSLACTYAKRLDINCGEVEANDWSEMNHRVTSVLAYRGFERLFCVIFWFLWTGIVGAFIYRLMTLYRDYCDDTEEYETLKKAIWFVEWIPVRVFGITLALTGNFSSCFARWKHHFWCGDRSSIWMITYYIESALNITRVDIDNPRCGEVELQELSQLYTRTLIFWVCFIAVVTIFI
ncbi:hypothetical protein MAH1_08320 [Sessilibacter sp. MAH1]